MTVDYIREKLLVLNPEALFADGFDDALAGIVEVNDRHLALYDAQKIIDLLMNRDGMAEGDAWEHFEFNMVGAYLGPDTPIFHMFRFDFEKET